MRPFSGIVASPDGTIALRSGEEGSTKDKGTDVLVGISANKSRGRRTLEEQSIKIVPFSVLHTGKIAQILLHANFRAIKYTWFIHIVPGKERRSRSLVAVVRKLICPPGSYLVGCEVQIRGGARPAPTIKVFFAGLILDIQSLGSCLLVNVVVVIALDVRINNGHHPPSLAIQLLDHVDRIGKCVVIPSEVALAISVFDIEPQHVVRIVQLFELGMNGVHIRLIPVVPSALVISQGKHRRERDASRQPSILLVQGMRIGPREKKEVHDARFGHEMSCRSMSCSITDAAVVVGTVHIDKCFGGVEPKDSSCTTGKALTDDDGNFTIQSHRLV